MTNEDPMTGIETTETEATQAEMTETEMTETEMIETEMIETEMTETAMNRPAWRTALDAVVPSAKVLYRLARDERVPRRTRMLALGALVYAIVPVDLIPDGIPVLGKVDDIALAGVAVVRLIEDAGPELLEEHWDGDQASLQAFRGAIDTIAGLIPQRVHRFVSLLDQ